MKLSIVIPARNAAGNIEPILDQIRQRLRREGITYEIVLVNDARSDATTEGCGPVARPVLRADFSLRLDAFRASLGIHGATACTVIPNQTGAVNDCGRQNSEVTA